MLTSVAGPIRSKLTEGSDDDTDKEDEDAELLEIDRDVQELKKCTESIRSMNVFSASTHGTRAFQGLVTTGGVCQDIFGKIKDLAASVARMLQTTVGQGGCCSKVAALVTEAKNMLHCIRLSNLISKFAEIGKKLIMAMVSFLKVAWAGIRNFMEQFGAAKKLQNFVNHLNPVKKLQNFANSVNPAEKLQNFASSVNPGEKLQNFANGVNPLKNGKVEDMMDSITSGGMCLNTMDPTVSKAIVLFWQSRNILRACGPMTASG